MRDPGNEVAFYCVSCEFCKTSALSSAEAPTGNSKRNVKKKE